jgi:hypothetical protein
VQLLWVTKDLQHTLTYAAYADVCYTAATK